MDIINKYFKQYADKVSFIELQENIDFYEKHGLKDIPLPIILDEMIEGVKSNNFVNEIRIEYLINGMLYMVAVDPEFIYINEYKEILSNLLIDPTEYALSNVAKIMDKNFIDSLIYSRAAFLLNERNELAAYNYAKLLWNLDVPEEEKHVYVEQAVRILERILRHNENNALANYELGNINTRLGNYVKANNFYRKALNNTHLDELQEQIRNNMNIIAPDIAVENAIYHINKMDYSSALEELMEVRKNSSRYDIPYYIAISYMNQGIPDMAEKFFEEAIDKGADFANLYTDLVYIKYLLNKDIEALEIANDALEKFPSEIKLRYNRAVIYVSIKQYDKANEDFDFILEYQDLSDELYNQIMIIKESIGGLNDGRGITDN